MIVVDHIETWGFEHAIRGMRNPMMSHDKSDSYWVEDWTAGKDSYGYKYFKVGDDDINLMQRLYKASLSGDNHAHRKYLRQIMVSMDITAPRYWWAEADTYKVGTVANSASTMHKIAAKEFTVNDFSHEHVEDLEGMDYNYCYQHWINTVQLLNDMRSKYLETKDKKYWWQLIQCLPQSYNQLRTVTMNYENVFTIINQRTGHKLDEWNRFVDILWKLPYVREIKGVEDNS